MASGLKLMPYQKQGVAFLTSSAHKLLGDDMGLGKTPQTVVAMHNWSVGRVLIVCPSSVKYNWAREILAWSDAKPNEIFVVTNGATIVPRSAKYIIVNYELLIRKKLHQQLMELEYDVLVCDEAHYLKTPDSKRTIAVLGRSGLVHRAVRKYLLTGTPVLNRPIELFPILRTLAPEVIAPHLTYVQYGRYFCAGKKTNFGWNFNGASNIEELRQRLQDSGFFLRRSKEDVLNELPPVVEQVIDVDVDIDPDMTEDTTAAPTLRRLIAEAKIPIVLAEIKERMQIIDKLVVFTYHREVTETLYEKLSYLRPVKVYGGLTAEEKQKAVDTFVNNPECRLFIGQVKAAGQGIDGLQKVCNYVMFAEIDWSPGVMDQARDRLRRIGQDHTVVVWHVIARNSIEERIVSALDYKRSVINKLMKPQEVINDMGLEEQISRLADAVEELTKKLNVGVGAAAAATSSDEEELTPQQKAARTRAAKKAEKEAAAKKAEETKADEAPEISEDEVRKAATATINVTADTKGNKTKVKALIAEYGGKIEDIPVEDRAEFLEKLNDLSDKLKAQPEDEGDDL